MTSLLFVLAILAAAASLGQRRMRRVRLVRADARRAGSSPERAIPVRRFDEMDGHLQGRWCRCGGYLERRGEGTREIGARRFRVARLRCQECERDAEVFFDTSEMLH